MSFDSESLLLSVATWSWEKSFEVGPSESESSVVGADGVIGLSSGREGTAAVEGGERGTSLERRG